MAHTTIWPPKPKHGSCALIIDKCILNLTDYHKNLINRLISQQQQHKPLLFYIHNLLDSEYGFLRINQLMIFLSDSWINKSNKVISNYTALNRHFYILISDNVFFFLQNWSFENGILQKNGILLARFKWRDP